jgi:diguanylate cyclase (GGDEF)-like protein
MAPAFGQNPRAVEAVARAQQLLDPHSPSHDDAQAMNALKTAIEIQPNWAVPHVMLAKVRAGYKDYAEAAKEMELVLTKPLPFKASDTANYWTLLGRYRFEDGKLDAASTAFEKAVGFDKKYHEANYYLAQIALKKDDMGKALEYVKAAIDGQPGNQAYRTLQANILFKQGHLDEASTEVNGVLEKLSGMKDSKEYIDASELQSRIKAALSARFWKKAAIVGGPILLLVLGGAGFMMMKGGRSGPGAAIDMAPDMGGDASSYEEISAMALRRLSALTQMTHGVMYISNLDGDEMAPRATLQLETDEVRPMPVDLNELPRWVERNDGKPYLFKAEKKEGGFIKAFPEARELMEPLQIRIGVPLLFQDRLLGMAFLGVEESKDILRLKKLYDRSQGDIYRIAVEYAAAMYRLYDDELAYIDVLTKFKSRRYVEENLPRALVDAEDAGRKGAVVMFDFDQFRGLQEQYGDPQAEAVLKSVAAEIKLAIPADDGIVARFEAGKFFAYAPVANNDEAYQFAERIKTRVADTRISRNFPAPTASLGLAIFPDNGKKADDLIWAADRVMMGTSAAGGNAIATVDGAPAPPAGSAGSPPPAREEAPVARPETVEAEAAPAAGRPFMPGRQGAAEGEPPRAPFGAPKPFGTASAAPKAAPDGPPKTGFVPGFSGGVLKAGQDGAAGGRAPSGGSGLLKGPGAPAAPKAGGIPGFAGGGAPSAAPPPPPPPPVPPRTAPPSVPGFSGAPPQAAPPPPATVPKASPFPGAPGGAPAFPGAPRSPFPGAPPKSPFPGAPPSPFPAPAEPKAAFPGAPPPAFPGAAPKSPFPGAPPSPFPGAPPAARSPFPGAPPSVEPPSAAPEKPAEKPAAAARIPGFGGSKKPVDLDAPTVRSPLDGPTIPWGRNAGADEVAETPAAPARPPAPPWVKAELEAEPEPEKADAPPAPSASSSGLSAKRGGGLLGGGSSGSGGLVAKPRSGAGAGGGKLFRRPDEGGKEKPRLTLPSPAAAAAPATAAVPEPLEIQSSDRDPQTGFVGTEVLLKALRRELERAQAGSDACSVLYFQLDRQGEITQAVGGERLASIQSEIASLVNDFLKEGTDIPGLWNEGFVIVLPRTSSRIACNLAEQIRFTVSNLSFPGLSANSTISIGIAACPEHGDTAENLLDCARQASVAAEAAGGNSIQVFGA